ncbi:hypothetical protein L828_1074 [Mycobacteroides abscessus MAB_030201_1061]|nr:hypothetical protein L828_1074 [Mycobacteroides abscessus MAB_030201_1061]
MVQPWRRRRREPGALPLRLRNIVSLIALASGNSGQGFLH